MNVQDKGAGAENRSKIVQVQCKFKSMIWQGDLSREAHRRYGSAEGLRVSDYGYIGGEGIPHGGSSIGKSILVSLGGIGEKEFIWGAPCRHCCGGARREKRGGNGYQGMGYLM